jgi:N-acetylglucosaminyldiphosphoundecaprenol N-acetyl-beta-D-mannosaminyltransferase
MRVKNAKGTMAETRAASPAGVTAGNCAGKTVDLFGLRFDNLTWGDVCLEVARRVRERDLGYIVTPNVDHLCMLRRSERFRQVYAGAAMVLADGVPVIFASSLLGKPLKAKLSGSDMVPVLCEAAAREGFSVFFLGAAPGVAERAARNLREHFPGLDVAGCYSPPMGFDTDPAQNEEAVRRVRESGAAVCLVAIGAPRQEYWMQANQRATGVPVMAGIGAALDFVAGEKRRAPLWMQRAGLEWVHRLLSEPRRLWKRYLVDDLAFLPILLAEWRHPGSLGSMEDNKRS